MLRRFSLCLITIAVMTPAVRAQVAISFAPATLEPGVATDLTMRLTDTSGADAEYTSIILTFGLSDGLTLGDFRWSHDEIANPDLWFTLVDLVRVPSQAQAVAWSSAVGSGLVLGPNETVDVSVMTVTASAAAAGTTQAISVIPANPSDEGITDTDFGVLEIDSGATFSIAVSSTGGTAGGGDPPVGDPGGPVDDPGADTGGGEPDVPGDGGDTPTDPSSDGDTPTGPGNDDGADDPDAPPDDVVVDEPGGNDPVAGGGDGGDAGAANGGGNEPDGAASDDAATGGSDPAPICGLGMIGPGLFTLAALSVMKLHRRRRW